MSLPKLTITKTLALITASWQLNEWEQIDLHLPKCYEMAREVQRMHAGKTVLMHLGEKMTLILEEDLSMNITSAFDLTEPAEKAW